MSFQKYATFDNKTVVEIRIDDYDFYHTFVEQVQQYIDRNKAEFQGRIDEITKPLIGKRVWSNFWCKIENEEQALIHETVLFDKQSLYEVWGYKAIEYECNAILHILHQHHQSTADFTLYMPARLYYDISHNVI